MTDLPPIVQILNGHTSEENAYVVDDYPYKGPSYKIRYWLETPTKGAKAGQTRFASQRTIPRKSGEAWYKPKYSTYSPGITVMYLNERKQVHCTALNYDTWRSPGCFDRVLAAPGLTDDDRQAINVLIKLLEKNDALQEARRLEQEARLTETQTSGVAAAANPIVELEPRMGKTKTIDPDQTFAILNDPGHGWLAVPAWMLAELQVAVSPFSYISANGKFAYLEEDLDMTTFWKAFEAKFGHPPKYASHYESVSSVRPLRSFKPELCVPPIVIPAFLSKTP